MVMWKSLPLPGLFFDFLLIAQSLSSSTGIAFFLFLGRGLISSSYKRRKTPGK
jgi:hypothetical protein